MPLTPETRALVLPVNLSVETVPVPLAPTVALAPAATPVSLSATFASPKAFTATSLAFKAFCSSFLICARVLRATLFVSTAPAKPMPAPSAPAPTPTVARCELISVLSCALTVTSPVAALLIEVLLTSALVLPLIVLVTTVASTATPACAPKAIPLVTDTSRSTCSASALTTKPVFLEVVEVTLCLASEPSFSTV